MRIPGSLVDSSCWRYRNPQSASRQRLCAPSNCVIHLPCHLSTQALEARGGTQGRHGLSSLNQGVGGWGRRELRVISALMALSIPYPLVMGE